MTTTGQGSDNIRAVDPGERKRRQDRAPLFCLKVTGLLVAATDTAVKYVAVSDEV